jgi:hypothetical protein
MKGLIPTGRATCAPPFGPTPPSVTATGVQPAPDGATWEPVSGFEPLTCRLQEVRPYAACTLAALMARVIALIALVGLELSGAPVHEPVHEWPPGISIVVTRCSSRKFSTAMTLRRSGSGDAGQDPPRRDPLPQARRQRPGSASGGPPGRTPGHAVKACRSIQLSHGRQLGAAAAGFLALRRPAPRIASRPPAGLVT